MSTVIQSLAVLLCPIVGSVCSSVFLFVPFFIQTRKFKIRSRNRSVTAQRWPLLTGSTLCSTRIASWWWATARYVGILHYQRRHFRCCWGTISNLAVWVVAKFFLSLFFLLYIRLLYRNSWPPMRDVWCVFNCKAIQHRRAAREKTSGQEVDTADETKSRHTVHQQVV